MVCLRFLFCKEWICTIFSLWHVMFIFKMHWIFIMFLFSTWEFHQPQFVLYLRFLINMHGNCAIHHDKPNIFHFELSSHWLSSHSKLEGFNQLLLSKGANQLLHKDKHITIELGLWGSVRKVSMTWLIQSHSRNIFYSIIIVYFKFCLFLTFLLQHFYSIVYASLKTALTAI